MSWYVTVVTLFSCASVRAGVAARLGPMPTSGCNDSLVSRRPVLSRCPFRPVFSDSGFFLSLFPLSRLFSPRFLSLLLSSSLSAFFLFFPPFSPFFSSLYSLLSLLSPLSSPGEREGRREEKNTLWVCNFLFPMCCPSLKDVSSL